jgi:cytochrome oxidase Cu insertion factor (SCO1/SenC/PrrC family)
MSKKGRASRHPARVRGVGVWVAIIAVAAIVLAVLIAAALQPTGSSQSQSLGIRLGATAPTNSLQATDGQTVSLRSYEGHPVVAFFYESAT